MDEVLEEVEVLTEVEEEEEDLDAVVEEVALTDSRTMVPPSVSLVSCFCHENMLPHYYEDVGNNA